MLWREAWKSFHNRRIEHIIPLVVNLSGNQRTANLDRTGFCPNTNLNTMPVLARDMNRTFLPYLKMGN